MFLLTCISFVSVIFLSFKDKIIELLSKLLETGFSLNGRGELYKQAWEAFLRHPLFGDGWFFITNQGDVSANSFAPQFKVHNILLQLLGSTGIFGLLCFIGFIFLLSYVTFKHTNIEKKVFASSILVLILTSIVDNFFFDYGFERFLAIFLVGLALSSSLEDLPFQKVLNRIGAK